MTNRAPNLFSAPFAAYLQVRRGEEFGLYSLCSCFSGAKRHIIITQIFGPYEDLVTAETTNDEVLVHISRSPVFEKQILQVTVQGCTRRSKQNKKWADNFQKRTYLPFSLSQRRDGEGSQLSAE